MVVAHDIQGLNKKGGRNYVEVRGYQGKLLPQFGIHTLALLMREAHCH